MLSARLHPSGWFADASSPMDHRKTSSTVMKICKKRTALHCLKGQDPPPSLSKWKQKTGTGKKIALSKNHNLDQSYLFGTNSCHQPLVPNSILSRKGANVLFFSGHIYIFILCFLLLPTYYSLTFFSGLSKSFYTWLINSVIIIHRENDDMQLLS